MPWWPHLHYYWVKSYFCYPSKKTYQLFLLTLNSQKLLLEKLCDLRDAMPRHWSLCFLLSPCYLQDTMPCQWSSSDLPRVLRVWESDFYSQAFFTLHSFLLVLRPPCGRKFNLKVSSASCWSSKHSPGPAICLNHNNPQKGL